MFVPTYYFWMIYFLKKLKSHGSKNSKMAVALTVPTIVKVICLYERQVLIIV
jgi:hypothetical protein